MSVKPGTLLGRYRLVSRAGAGGMSEVWKAEDETLHRTVAVKVILDPISADAAFTERFLREARLVAGLDHPNVLPVFDFGSMSLEGKDVSYLVMPLVTGGALKDRIRGPVPFGQAVAWLAGIAEALDHAHGKGILHRDVKPGNVLLDATGRPLLADFGLARTADSASGLTATGTVLGTPSYMAPEQATGQALDGRADQYALAVIAFEMLTGRVPFKADSPLAVLHQHVTMPPAALTTVIAGIPREADDVMHQALAKDPAARFPSCSAFIAALATALGVSVPAQAISQPVIARPVPPPLPPPPGASQGVTVVTGASFPAPAEAMAAPSSRPPASPPSSGAGRAVLISAAVVLALVAAGTAGWFLLKPQATQPLLAGGSSSPAPGTGAPTAASAPAAPTAEPPATADAALPSPSTGPQESTPASVASAAEPVQAVAEPAAPATRSEPATAAPSAGPGRPRGAADRPVSSGAQPRKAEAAVPPPAEEPPASLPRREPLVSASAHAADTSLSKAYAALDTTLKRDGRLAREDFASALGDAREVASRRPSDDARFLDAFCRAAISFAGGDTQDAWLLLDRAFQADASGASSGRVLSFVRAQQRALGRNPGADAGWVMGLAFGNVRGDLDEELEKAGERAPDSVRVAYARALWALESRRSADAKRWARRACDDGLPEACDLLGSRRRGR